MEELKRFKELVLPDERLKHLVSYDQNTGDYRQATIENFYKEVASIKLHKSVPQKIRSHFAVVQNLLVYSWFFYPFNVTAEFMAFVTVEFALRERLKPEPRKPFRELLKLAVEQGLITDDGFSHFRVRQEIHQQLTPFLELQPVKKYVDTLVKVIPFLRNMLAHGTEYLHPNGILSVEICADIINQLFMGNTS